MNPNKPIILCVDDEEVNLHLLKNILVPKGYELIMAADGESALTKIKSVKIDLVLLDVMMPGMTGFDVCKEIKESDDLRDIPVIMLTSLHSKSDRITGIESGAEDFITKPFNKDEVLARIANLLKVKQLNDALKAAYSNINSLTVAGGSLIKSVNTLNFRFMPVLDMMVEQIVRKSDKMYDKPLIILVRVIEDKKNYKWYRYGYTNKIQRHPFVLDAWFMTEGTESSSIFYSNNPAQEKTFAPLVENLKRYNISAENLICYLSDALVIVALNYGRDVTIYDAAVLETLVVQTLFMRSLSVQIKETEKSFEYTVHALARASEANDDDTGNHIYRVGEYCALLAKKMNMPDSFVKDIRLQATLHDVGKIHVHPDILRKPVALTHEQWVEMKQHPVFAANIIGNHKRLELARVIAMTHHEKWDGSGYPYGLAHESIHIGGRITAIADCYDALRNRRGYKPCFDHTTTFKIITEGDNRTKPNHFDPNILAVFKEIASMFEDVYERLKNK